MVIDDTLPCLSNGGGGYYLVFDNHGADNSIWGAFIEKLWAKVVGNYEFTWSGWFTEAVKFLTGAPTISY